MPKDRITAFDATAANNTDIGGVGIEGSDNATNTDDAHREMMSILKDHNDGTYPVADTWAFADPATLTKQVRLDAGSVSANQTRVLSAPDKDITLAGLVDLTPKTVTTVTSSNANFALQSGTEAIRLTIQAAGGGSGGCNSSGVTVATSTAGGGGGECIVKSFDVSALDPKEISITIGAAGAAGLGSGPTAGGAGGNTSVTVDATTVTASGGSGSTAGAAALNLFGRAGAAGGSGGSGDILKPGTAGAPSVSSGDGVASTHFAQGGNGGNSYLGSGGVGAFEYGATASRSNGAVGSGYGWGGAGSASIHSSGAANGIAGGAGCVIVEEF